MKAIFLLCALSFAFVSCDPGIWGTVAVHNTTSDTLRVGYHSSRHSNLGWIDTVVCYPDSTRLLFTFMRIGIVRYFRLTDELDSIVITNTKRTRTYASSLNDSNWTVKKDYDWTGGGTADYVYEVK